ncbi:MAG: homoserine O-acetyltransferase, partial [Rhodoglobus sp.]|nr:homoserine O-acetyltransferase [Rhodoglobus sp.]
LTLVEAMSSHDVGRGRGGTTQALTRVTARALILGIDSDRLFPVADQEHLARHISTNLDGDDPVVIASPYGHDGFLIEDGIVGTQLARLLAC